MRYWYLSHICSLSLNANVQSSRKATYLSFSPNHLPFPQISECKQQWLYRDCADLRACLCIRMSFCMIQTKSREAAFLIYVFLHSTNYETLLLKMLSKTSQYIPEKHLIACHCGPTNETPFECYFAGGPIVA